MRHCERCHAPLKPEEDYRCITCDNTLAAARSYTSPPAIKTGETVCARCHWPFKTDGYKNCPQCRAKSRAYRKEHLEEIHTKEKRYYQAHRDEALKYAKERRQRHQAERQERDRKYYLLHRKTILERAKLRRQKHLEHDREYMRNYRKKHPEAKIMSEHRRRARIEGNGGSYTKEEEELLFVFQKGLCHYCGIPLYASYPEKYHVEHKTPLSRHGTNNIENIALTCPTCNRHKKNKTEEEYNATTTPIS